MRFFSFFIILLLCNFLAFTQTSLKHEFSVIAYYAGDVNKYDLLPS